MFRIRVFLPQNKDEFYSNYIEEYYRVTINNARSEYLRASKHCALCDRSTKIEIAFVL